MGWASEGGGKDATDLDSWDKITACPETGPREEKQVCRGQWGPFSTNWGGVPSLWEIQMQTFCGLWHVEEIQAKVPSWLSKWFPEFMMFPVRRMDRQRRALWVTVTPNFQLCELSTTLPFLVTTWATFLPLKSERG